MTTTTLTAMATMMTTTSTMSTISDKISRPLFCNLSFFFFMELHLSRNIFFSQKINPHILSRTISVSPGFLLPSLNSTIGATMTLAVHSCMYFTTWKILHHRLPIPYHNQCDQASKEKKAKCSQKWPKKLPQHFC